VDGDRIRLRSLIFFSMFIATRPITMPLTLILILTLLYLGGMLAFAISLRRPIAYTMVEDLPSVAVVIAARNEEESIAECLHSMSALDYPADRLRIIVVDDHSEDRTAEIVRDFAGRFPAISLVEAGEPEGHLRGKVKALVRGIEETTSDIIMMTDADCTVRPEWVRKTTGYFADPGVDLVAGFIRVDRGSWFVSLQALDWLFLISAASAGARLGFPVTAVGNNLSVRRSAYNAVGGYRELRFNVTEDLALFQAVTGQPDRRAVIPLDIESSVSTEACPSWSSLFHQRKRWFIGGKRMTSSRTAALAVVCAFYCVVLSGWAFLSIPLWGGIVAAKFLADYAMVSPSLQVLGGRHLVRYWIPFQLYLCFYVILFPLLAILSPRVTWKGRGFGGRNEKSPPTTS